MSFFNYLSICSDLLSYYRANSLLTIEREDNLNTLNHLMVLLSKGQCKSNLLFENLSKIIDFSINREFSHLSIHIDSNLKDFISLLLTRYPLVNFSINHKNINNHTQNTLLRVNLMWDSIHSQKEAFCLISKECLVNVDLIISFRSGELNLQPCMPWIIGFAEISHHPILPTIFPSLLVRALFTSIQRFYGSKQNFGK